MDRIETESFVLAMEMQLSDPDREYPANALLGVSVRSCGFAAETTMDVGTRELGLFAGQLMALYQTLSGRARLEEPYGRHSYLEFAAEAMGHIRVRGTLYSSGGYAQALSFENVLDQTELQAFARVLFARYAG